MDTGELKTAEVNETSLAYLEAGQGPAILLLHAAFGSHRLWAHQIPAFAASYRVIAPDLRGHGESGREPGVYSIQLFADDVLALLDALGVQETLICGHALGGMVAQLLASREPERVRGLVLAETNYGSRSTWYEALASRLTRPLFRRIGVERMVRLSINDTGRHSPSLKPVLASDMEAYLSTPEVYWAIVDAILAFEGRARLGRIACPTLVMVGARNRYSHRQAKVMARAIPWAQFFILPEAGHALQWDNSAGFNQAALDFFRTLA